VRVAYNKVYGGPVVVYEQAGPPRFCCDGMRRVWADLIGFGLKGHARTSYCGVGLFTVYGEYLPRPIPGVIDIRYCPWCGDRIEVVRAP